MPISQFKDRKHAAHISVASSRTPKLPHTLQIPCRRSTILTYHSLTTCSYEAGMRRRQLLHNIQYNRRPNIIILSGSVAGDGCLRQSAVITGTHTRRARITVANSHKTFLFFLYWFFPNECTTWETGDTMPSGSVSVTRLLHPRIANFPISSVGQNVLIDLMRNAY